MTKSLPRTALLALILVSALAIACGGDYSNDDSGPAIAPGEGAPAGLPDNGGDGVEDADDNFSGQEPAGVGGGSIVGGGENQNQNLPDLNRQIIRTATVQITVDDVAGTIQLIENAAIGAGGFVSASSLTVESEESEGQAAETVRQRGTITIRVPADRYADVISDLRGVAEEPGDITSLESETTEVTEEYTDLQSRLRNLEATESQYLILLERAATIEEVLTVQDRLNTIRADIEQVQGRLQVLDDLTALATITIQLSPPSLVPVVGSPDSQHWATEALENSWQASEETLKVLGIVGITAGVFAAWLLIPGVIVLGAWWVVNGRRARREAA